MGPANLPHGTHRVQCFEMKVRDICQLQLNFKTNVQSLSRSFLKLPWSSSCQSSEQGKSIHQKKFSKDFGLRAVRLVSGVVVQVLGFKHEIRLTGHNFHSASKETISAGRPVSTYVQIDFYKWMQELYEYFAWNLFVYSSSNIIWRLCRLDGELESLLAFLADRLLIRTWGCTAEEHFPVCFRFEPLKPWRTKDNMMIMLTDAQPGQLQEIAKLLSGVLSEFWMSDDIAAYGILILFNESNKSQGWCLMPCGWASIIHPFNSLTEGHNIDEVHGSFMMSQNLIKEG